MQASIMLLFLAILPLPGLYLRYLPFTRFITPPQRDKLLFCYGIWFLLLFLINIYVFFTSGFSVHFYKLSAMLSWLPYLAINIVLIPNHLEHHIFVAGMQCLYVMLLHGTAVLLLLYFEPQPTVLQFGYLQTVIYMLLFAATFPLIRRFFNRVFWSDQAVSNRSYWRTVCLLPFLVSFESITLSYSDDILATQLLVPRLILLGTFCALIYAFSYDVSGLEESAELDANNQFLALQLSTLKDHTRLIDDGNQKMAVIRHNIRHYNQLLSTLIQDGKKDAALSFINDYDNTLTQTTVPVYCANPIINAALAIYIRKARQEHLPLAHNIQVTELPGLDENELAILICNLLENALRVSQQQPEADRQVNVTAKADKDHLLLTIENRCREPVLLGEDELPVTRRRGHGLGMRSLAAFRDKYGATVLCGQQDGWFRTLIRVNRSKD